jgi:hypothetical protein
MPLRPTSRCADGEKGLLVFPQRRRPFLALNVVCCETAIRLESGAKMG